MPRIRVWTSGLEFDALVVAAMGRKAIGAGYSFGDCARDMDFDFDSIQERDEVFDHAQKTLGGIAKLEKQ